MACILLLSSAVRVHDSQSFHTVMIVPASKGRSTVGCAMHSHLQEHKTVVEQNSSLALLFEVHLHDFVNSLYLIWDRLHYK